MKKKIQQAIKFYKYICKQDPKNICLYSNAFVKDIQKIAKD